MKFDIECEVPDRWVPHFLGFLRYLQHCGGAGKSRVVSVFADGDGDFQPKFNWDSSLPSPAEPRNDQGGNRLYDAG